MNRRAGRWSRRIAAIFVAAAVTSLAGAAETPGGADEGPTSVAPGYRPAPGTDEAGFWSMADKAERELRNSRFLVRDRALDDYLRGIACRLATAHCADIRIYVVRTPHFNAAMYPNGMMQVWTGLFLRVRDEAQLATVLGHEIGHYLHTHTIRNYRAARDASAISAVLSIGLAAAGAGSASSLTNLALSAGLLSFNRDQEREADGVGLELMAKAGYDTTAASEVWSQLIDERKAAEAQDIRVPFFATHPMEEERMEALREQAGKRAAAGRDRGADRLSGVLARFRQQLLDDELGLRQYGRSEAVFERLLVASPRDGSLWFAKGEVYRLRAGEGDGERAIAAYRKALEVGGAPPEVHRSTALIEWKAGARDRAREALAQYLRARPDAPDREILQEQLSEGS
jgi:predicted Zn-dependent protease